MSGSVKWNAAALTARLDREERACVKSLALHWVRAAQERVNVSAGGVSKRAVSIRRSRGRLVGQLGREYAADLRKGFTPRQASKRAADTYEQFRHSKPGEPPRTITGFGKLSITHRVLERRMPTARAGLFRNALYMWFLENGFTMRGRGGRRGRRVEPRPWALKTFRAEMPAFRAIANRLGGRIV